MKLPAFLYACSLPLLEVTTWNRIHQWATNWQFLVWKGRTDFIVTRASKKCVLNRFCRLWNLELLCPSSPAFHHITTYRHASTLVPVFAPSFSPLPIHHRSMCGRNVLCCSCQPLATYPQSRDGRGKTSNELWKLLVTYSTVTRPRVSTVVAKPIVYSLF